ncbi:MAG: ABC transporter permease subunit [Endozoicomonas sp. (ex Botrylloides leachii)]|nr:ABC transporter permease subunit [Endozoicomonas sp. (ex Botrylloides leachii)]
MKRLGFSTAMLGAGILFLYLPMFILIFYSFNASKLVTVWAGFSGKWYIGLFQNQQLMSAAWVSLRIAFYNACMAVILGTMAAYIMARYRRFKGKTLFASITTAPLIMPDVIIGLSLLLMFVSLSDWFGWPAQRGILTIWLAHVTFSTSYVAVVVGSRLREVDMSIEEAAMDLGAPPVKTFFLITVPSISSALVSAWLLAFTLSLDDLVIASFVSGPDATTLPMMIFSSVRLGVSPEINALATLIILAVALATTIVWWLMRRSNNASYEF